MALEGQREAADVSVPGKVEGWIEGGRVEDVGEIDEDRIVVGAELQGCAGRLLKAAPAVKCDRKTTRQPGNQAWR